MGQTPEHSARITCTRLPLARFTYLRSGSVTEGYTQMKSIGMLFSAGPDSVSETIIAGLARRGFIDGKSARLEPRFACGNASLLPELARDLVEKNVDVIIAAGAITALAAKGATTKIPIVFAGVIDPVEGGLIENLQRPGGNVTGVTTFDPLQPRQQFEILMRVVPALRKLAIVSDVDIPRHAAPPHWNTLEWANRKAAIAAGLEAKFYRIQGPQPKTDEAIDQAMADGADALLVLDVPITIIHSKHIASVALKHRLPSMFLGGPRMADAGGLMAYGTGLGAALSEVPKIVETILQGSRPSETPVVVINRHILLLNDNCAEQLGVQFPMYSKLVATGPGKHPLYAALTAAKPETEDRAGMEEALRGYKIEPTAAPEVLWNFEKFLIGRDGQVLRRFAPDTAPDADKLVAAIEAALAA